MIDRKSRISETVGRRPTLMLMMMRLFWATIVFTVGLVMASIGLLNVHADLLDASARLANVATTHHVRMLALVDEEAGVRGFVKTHDPQFLDTYARARTMLRANAQDVRSESIGDSTIDAATASQIPAAEELQRTFAGEIHAAATGDRQSASRLMAASQAEFDAFRSRDEGIESAIGARLAAIRRRMIVNTRRAPLLPVLGGLTILVAATVVFVLFGKISFMRKAAERANELEEVNRLMTIAEEMVKVGYWRYDVRSGEISWSDEVYRIHGFPASQSLTLESALAAYHPDDRNHVRASIEHALRAGTPYRYEARIVWPTGAVRTIVANGQADRRRDGTIAGLFGAIQDISDRKTVECEQQRLMERVSLATEAAQFGIWEFDLARGSLVWNSMMFALYGFADRQFEPHYDHWAQALHPDDRERTERALADAATGQTTFNTEFRIVLPSGEIRSLRSTATLVRDAFGSVERMIGTNWDITELRSMAETLRITAERDRATAASLREKNRLMNMAEQMAHVGHWRLDIPTRAVTWSEEMSRAFGFTNSQPGPAEILAACHPDDRANVKAIVRQCIATGQAFSNESRIVRSDGSIRHVVWSGQPEYGPDGTLAALVGVFQDISVLRNAEREREELTTRLRIATEGSRIGIWDWDIVRNAAYWDATMFALYGLDEAHGVPDHDDWVAAIHPDDRASMNAALDGALTDGLTYDTEFRIALPSGEIRSIHSMGSLVRDAAGRPLRLIGTNWDITEVRSLSEQLQLEKERLVEAKKIAEDTSRAKSDFLAHMSHEIRTPMNGIIGLTSLLLDGDLTAAQRGQMTLLADAGRSLLAIINDILDLAKVEAGKITLESIALAPAGLTDGALSIVRAEALAKGITLEMSVAPDVPAWVAGDPTRLRQILLNLLSNAIKFTHWGGVAVAVRRDECAPDALRFEIADTGIGIAPDRRDEIFESFSQADRSIARRFGGSGLGLAISKRLAEAMSGTIGMTSVLGAGSVFWFTARLPEIASPANLEVAEPVVASVPRRILVVDDNALNRIVAHGLLLQDGHDLHVAVDGVQALAAITASRFDLVFMDVQMPLMDGLEVTRRVRAIPGPIGTTPIVALTANAMAEEAEKCREAGMNDHLAKPIDRALLRRMVLRWAESTETGPAIASPATPEFDLALRRLGNNRALFTNLATVFIDDSGPLLEELRHQLHAGDAAAAALVLHKVRGMAATLGNVSLAEIAARLERELESNGRLSDPARDLATLDADFAAAAEALADTIASFGPWRAPARGVSNGDVPGRDALLDELDRLLVGANMRAVGVCGDLRQQLGSVPDARVAPLVAAVTRLDFALAREELDRLRASL